MRVRTRATPAGKGGRRETPGRGSATNGSDAPDEPQIIGTRYVYDCPSCDGEANATYKLDAYALPEWFIGCRKRGCEGRHLPTLAEAFGLDGGATKAQIAAAVKAQGRHGPAVGKVEPLPSEASIAGWHAALLGPAGSAARAYLSTRGVSLDVIAAERIGWNHKAITLPMFDAWGALAGFKTRLPRPGVKVHSHPGKGRPWPLYPPVATGAAGARGWTLLAAGELDALAARSAGLPASSVTLGAGYPAEGDKPARSGPGSPWWRDAWTADLRGLRVVVAFDNNEATQAEACVSGLRAAGIDARRLDLRRLGLDAPKGDLNDYLVGGGDPSALRPRRSRVVRRRSKVVT